AFLSAVSSSSPPCPNETSHVGPCRPRRSLAGRPTGRQHAAPSPRSAMLTRLVVTLLLAASPLAAQQVTALRFGSLVNATGTPVRDAVVVIQADSIVRIGSGSSAIPRGATVIDLRRSTAIPGLID